MCNCCFYSLFLLYFILILFYWFLILNLPTYQPFFLILSIHRPCMITLGMFQKTHMMSFGNKKNLTIFKPNWEWKSRILWGQIGILSGKTKIFEEKNQISKGKIRIFWREKQRKDRNYIYRKENWEEEKVEQKICERDEGWILKEETRKRERRKQKRRRKSKGSRPGGLKVILRHLLNFGCMGKDKGAENGGWRFFLSFGVACNHRLSHLSIWGKANFVPFFSFHNNVFIIKKILS